jgi:hypothetical protein
MGRLVELQSVADPARGTLVVLEAGRQVPFDFPRIFLLCDVPKGAIRGDHAHREQHQLLVATAGAFDVTAEDGAGQEHLVLDDPRFGLYVPPLTWVTLRATAPRSTCMVLTSAQFDEADYIRDRTEFKALLGRISPA